jgi:hypothetical protein
LLFVSKFVALRGVFIYLLKRTGTGAEIKEGEGDGVKKHR